MFGTMFRCRPKPGQQQAVIEQFQRWGAERRPDVAGVVASYLLTPQAQSGDLIGLAVFDSEANYRKNAEDPAQDRWYRQLRALLEDDPEWNDGEILAMER